MFTKEEYNLPFFHEYGYIRRKCSRCGEFFWTQKSNQKFCGESTKEGCAEYTFINNPPTRKPYSLKEMRESFLSFFEERGHARIKPYPLVARWRDDLYFTNASIIDFQPYVTEGLIPPPANPLVISQPCVRFPDLDSVGSTFGRHLTIFEMGGHHAFNYEGKEVYWKDETLRYHHEFVTETLGIRDSEVIYKEGFWSG
ncbi:MAG: alanine--tRNA ligase-related protein, partial [Candidatus Bathyarchaeia archaeon]